MKNLFRPPPYPHPAWVPHVSLVTRQLRGGGRAGDGEEAPGMHWKGGRYPSPLQGAQPMPSLSP